MKYFTSFTNVRASSYIDYRYWVEFCWEVGPVILKYEICNGYCKVACVIAIQLFYEVAKIV